MSLFTLKCENCWTEGQIGHAVMNRGEKQIQIQVLTDGRHIWTNLYCERCGAVYSGEDKARELPENMRRF